MRLGAHQSTAGGVDLAFARGREAGCEALQIHTRSARQWRGRAIGAEEVARFRAEAGATGWPVIAHDSYLINLAATDAEVRRRSIDALLEEMVCCETLGVPLLVIHPGCHLGAGVEEGVARVAEALSLLHRSTPGLRLRVLLEITAGQGTSLGACFEEIAAILAATEESERLGVCFDTCHAFAAGYDVASDAGYERTFAELDRVVGLDRLAAFHLNDSRQGLGCRVDRHEAIGRGAIGNGCFARLVRDPRFAHLPAVLETPRSSHVQSLRQLRRWRGRAQA